MSPWWLRPSADSEQSRPIEPSFPEPLPAEADEEPITTGEPARADADDESPFLADEVDEGATSEVGALSTEADEVDGAEGEPVGAEGETKTARPRRPRRGSRGGAAKRVVGADPAAPATSAIALAATAVEPAPEAEERRRPATPAARRASPAPEPRRHDITVHDIESVARELYSVPSLAPPERSAATYQERKIAMFCDLENVALGVRDSEIKKFDINLVLERLLEKGKIIVKKAYCDWERYSEYKRAFHEAAIELLDIPQKYYSGKNSADIKMVVDAMDLCYAKEHLDTFVIVSGDSDFSPLVSKLKENDKYVIGIGVKNSSSNLLIGNCDEFIYYEDIWRDQRETPQLADLSKKSGEVFGLMIDAIQALIRENKDVLWGSMIKQTMQRKKPSFNEGYYGYNTFSELLEDAERKNILKLKKDQRSGSYVVTGLVRR